MSDHTHHLIDIDRAVCLCDAGLPEYLAATAVADDGSEHFVLVLRAALGDERVRYDYRCSEAKHEQAGYLPWAMWERVFDFRCGRPRTNGKPCRCRVNYEGDVCRWHRGLERMDGLPI